MSRTALEVLVVHSDAGAASSVAAALRRRGLAVAVESEAEGCARHAGAHVLVCDLPALEALRARGLRQRAVVLDLPDCADAWRAALRLGAADALARPWRLAELVQAVEEGPRAPLPAAAQGLALRRSLELTPRAIDATLHELCAFLVRHSITPAARARALTACAEVLENAARHAFPDAAAGRVELSASLRARQVEVHVTDRGVGFDTARVPSDGGLARAGALAEDLRVSSQAGRGTRVTLVFHAWRVDLDGEGEVDLSELDWLAPDLARRVLASAGAGTDASPFHLSPALAVTVGRLLAGASERQRAERALWS